MPLLPAPAQLSHPEKDALIAALTRLALADAHLAAQATHIARQSARPWRAMAGVPGALCRDAKYAIECGDTAFSAPFRWLLLRAIAIGRRREVLKDTTLKQYLYDLDRRLDRIMAAVPVGEPGRKLHKRMLANRAHLFVFLSNRAVPFTNNIAEQHLQPSVIFRKVTNGFRCEWGAETYAAFRSVVSTAKANRASVFDTFQFVISAKRSGDALAMAG